MDYLLTRHAWRCIITQNAPHTRYVHVAARSSAFLSTSQSIHMEVFKMPQAYCVKDRKMVEMKDPKEITLKNGRSATQGTCPDCGTKVTRIGGGAAKAK